MHHRDRANAGRGGGLRASGRTVEPERRQHRPTSPGSEHGGERAALHGLDDGGGRNGQSRPSRGSSACSASSPPCPSRRACGQDRPPPDGEQQRLQPCRTAPAAGVAIAPSPARSSHRQHERPADGMSSRAPPCRAFRSASATTARSAAQAAPGSRAIPGWPHARQLACRLRNHRMTRMRRAPAADHRRRAVGLQHRHRRDRERRGDDQRMDGEDRESDATARPRAAAKRRAGDRSPGRPARPSHRAGGAERPLEQSVRPGCPATTSRRSLHRREALPRPADRLPGHAGAQPIGHDHDHEAGRKALTRIARSPRPRPAGAAQIIRRDFRRLLLCRHAARSFDLALPVCVVTPAMAEGGLVRIDGSAHRPEGRVLHIKGISLGSWLMPEGPCSGSRSPRRQADLRRLDRLLGPEPGSRVLEAVSRHLHRPRRHPVHQVRGFNTVRIPLH